MPARFAYLDHAGPIGFAHRGGALHGRENTMAAFADAVDLGYRYVETDVHATADDRLVAFHDVTLDRVTDRSGRIGDLRWEELRTVRVGSADDRVPLLEDLLGTWPALRVNVDVKAASAIAPLVAAVRRTGALDRVCVASFSETRLAAVRAALGPRLCTALGPRGVLRLRAASWAGRVLPLRRSGGGTPGAAAAQVPVRAGRVPVVDAAFVDRAHRLGLVVHVWTVDDAQEAERLLDLGVDGIMTDDTRMLREVLDRRGHWGS